MQNERARYTNVRTKKMKGHLITFLFLFLGSQAHSETIMYEIYEYIDNPDGVLIAKGTKDYSGSDINVVEKNHDGEIHWAKSLELLSGYGIGASIYREPKTKGFGLWGVGSPCGFSWEWFRLAEPGEFNKLKESGSVSVKFHKVDGLEEIVEIHFDTDISMRLNETRKKVGEVTHRILVKKGSVLKFSPNE